MTSLYKTASYCSLLVVGSFLIIATVFRPELLADQNHFLEAHVGANLLLVLGVILIITLASAGQIHLSLNDIESKVGHAFLHKTRSGVHGSVCWLIGLFIGSVVLVVIKPFFHGSAPMESLFNGTALFVLFWMVLIMASLTRLIFAIKLHFNVDQPYGY